MLNVKKAITELSDKITAVNTVINGKVDTSFTAFTPSLYDNTTFIRSLTTGTGHKMQIGNLAIIYIYDPNANLAGINTMVILGDLPVTGVLGGSFYYQGIGGDRTIQAQMSSNRALIRPNIKTSDISVTTGILSVCLICRT